MRAQTTEAHAHDEADAHSHPGRAHWVLEIDLDGSLHRVQHGRLVRRGGSLAFFDGLLHDRTELARELGVVDLDDAALVLAAYQRYGEAALARLRGSFALAIVDAMARLVLLARDPLGTHPLFYARRGRTVLFAATPRALLEQPGVSRELNRVALADRICLRWPDPGETYYAAVRRVPPGSRVAIGDGKLSIARYWDPLPPDGPAEWAGEDEVQQFGATLSRAVDRCLHTGRTGILLSGGLDSISVAAVAADRAREIGAALPLTLSLAFPDPGCDERTTQQAVARQLGLSQLLVDFEDAVGPRGLLREALDLNAGLSAPLLNTWSPAYLGLIQRGRAAGAVATVVTGSGGDEWLTVSPYAIADLLRRGDVRGIFHLLAAWRRSYRHSSLRFARNTLWTFGLRPLTGMAAQWLAPGLHAASRARRVTSADPDWIAPDPALRGEQLRRAPRTLGDAAPAQGFYFREIRTGLDHPLASQELEEQYELGQGAGVLYQQPYWDADLVAMLYRLSPDALNTGGRSKGLVRNTLARRFPGLGIDVQRKVSATGFYRALIHNEAPAVRRSLGRFEALGDLGVVDAQQAEEYARRIAAVPGHRLNRMWDLLNVEAWVRTRLAPA